MGTRCLGRAARIRGSRLANDVDVVGPVRSPGVRPLHSKQIAIGGGRRVIRRPDRDASGGRRVPAGGEGARGHRLNRMPSRRQEVTSFVMQPSSSLPPPSSLTSLLAPTRTLKPARLPNYPLCFAALGIIFGSVLLATYFCFLLFWLLFFLNITLS